MTTDFSGNKFIENRLVEHAFIQESEEGKSKVTQHAEIGGKRVKITLYFEHALTQEQALQAMNASLEKVCLFAEAFQLGQKNEEGETTSSLTVHQDSSVIRTFTKEGAEPTKKYVATNNPEEVSELLATLNKTFDAATPILKRELPQLPDQENDIEDENFENDQLGDFKCLTTLSANPTTKGAVGQEFKDEFFDDEGNLIAEEKVVRAETVNILLGGLETKISKLETKLAGLEKNSENADKINNLKEHIDKAKADLHKYQGKISEDTTWGSTNSTRFGFIHLGREGAKEAYAPVLCNLRMQTVANAAGEVVSSVNRSAAITDFSHGEVSLQELKDFQEMEALAKGDSISRKEELEKLYVQEFKALALQTKVKALVGYGLEALTQSEALTESDVKDLKVLLEKLAKAKSIVKTMESFKRSQLDLLEKVTIDQTKLNEIVNQREETLKLMVLQDLHLHLTTTPHVGDEPLLYSRVTLIDFKKEPNNEKGCILHERTQGLDMKAILQELEGATVVFDCEEGEYPYIDEEGQIHMPKNKDGQPASTTLNTAYFNVCVQGSSSHTVNDGMQKAINDEMLEKLRPKYAEDKDFKNLERKLNELSNDPNMDPNECALAAIEFLKKKGARVGANCYGGKDRTGYVMALVTHNALVELAGPINSRLRKWGRQLMGKEGVAAKVAQDNADHTSLKLTRFDLQLYGVKSIKGKMLRVAQGIDGIALGAQQIAKGLLGMSTLSESETPGQLYRPASKESTKIKVKTSFKLALHKDSDISTEPKP